MRRFTAAAAGAMAIALTLAAAQSQARPAAHNVRCATFQAPNMYSGGPQGNTTFAVYVTRGSVSCGNAVLITRGLAYGNGTIHYGRDSLHTYIRYRGWICPAGNMGATGCFKGSRPVRNPRTAFVSLECSVATSGCPARLPSY
jgi:hypothetical protein